MKLIATTLLLAAAISNVEAHGRLVKPPHRGYIGKLPQFKDYVPTDYSDHGLNGGGIEGTKGGQHGICGDPYNGNRAHETGGVYGLFPTHGAKVIGECYAPGATVDLQVQITANHKGYFEFGLCKLNSKGDKETEECFQTLSQPNGEKQWQLPAGADFFKMQYKLPSDVKCDGDSHCVLRWWYVGGNNPGVGINGQEQFWNCADIYISDSCGSDPKPSPSSQHPTPAPSSAKPTSAPSDAPTSKPSNVPSPTTEEPCDPTTAKPIPSKTPSPKPTSKTPVHPTTKPTVKPTTKPTSKPNSGGGKKVWEQCGGKDYTGSTECVGGSTCVKQDEWYSQCVPKRLR
ncbi:hypothetical protein SDRG_16162 [Saprolegnia diclina VS20]|uniref:CBM1 domain-containing protein n=1 Tax=Saprolegnia diclina (strain VS20) TaxID=1156394 RepID=T0PY88_SAPDV|nr:hypothetical protein SDRG_16162 [Saprolegnia diclina VS20]EQC26015.1 hypothetical protein SDRG_16162 [Saprolegnia diclina VS20]|eukprot:XP_008620583.1 hypothetical protein SDRG_16162 [Saprolegnia diclina VS20]